MPYIEEGMKIGIVGVGHLGKIHLKLWNEIKEVEVVGFYDTNTAVHNSILEEFGVKPYASFHELLMDVDIIDVVSPTLSHYVYASETIKANKHCFIEKPVSSTAEEAKKLLSLTHEAGVKVQIGHVERFNPAFIAAKPFIQKPMFIETHRLSIFNPRGTDVPVVHDLMIHDIDIVLSVVKSGVHKIAANAVSVVSESADIANARIEFDNGCVANLTASRISLKNMRKTRFFQKDAYISVDFYEKTSEVIRMRDADLNSNPSLVIETGNGNFKKEIIFEQPEILPTNAIKEELLSFLACIKNNSNLVVPIEDGVAAIQIAEEIMNKINKTSS